MSCRVLEDLTAEHTLLDDRESAMWVLIWVTLNHSKTELSDDRLDDMQCSFNYARHGKSYVKGGSLKRDCFLHQGSEVKLSTERSGLQDLIATLQSAFVNCYGPPALEQDEKKKAKLDSMQCSSWLQDEFLKHLNMGNWPDSDEALDPNATASSHKRNSIQAGLELGDSGRAKSLRSSHLSKVASVGNSDQGENR